MSEVELVEDLSKLSLDELKDLVLKLKRNIVLTYIEFGRVLRYIRDNKIYEKWGYGSFIRYVEEEVGMKVRKAELLMDINKFVNKFELSFEKIKALDISKLYELARWDRAGKLNKDNVEKVVEKALAIPLCQLQAERGIKNNMITIPLLMNKESYESLKDLIMNHFKKDINDKMSWGTVISMLELFYRGFNFEKPFDDILVLLKKFEDKYKVKMFFVRQPEPFSNAKMYESLIELGVQILNEASKYGPSPSEKLLRSKRKYSKKVRKILKNNRTLDEMVGAVKRNLEQLKKYKEMMPWQF